MAKNVIIIDESERNFIQKADVECSARMNLISFLMKNNIGLDNERFIEYQEDYVKYFQVFETAKRDLERKYLAGKNPTFWNLDYNTCELTYET